MNISYYKTGDVSTNVTKMNVNFLLVVIFSFLHYTKGIYKSVCL